MQIPAWIRLKTSKLLVWLHKHASCHCFRILLLNKLTVLDKVITWTDARRKKLNRYTLNKILFLDVLLCPYCS